MAPRPSVLRHLARPAVPGRPVLLVHSWWGLTAGLTEVADSLAARGLLVGCVDLYDGAVARSPEEVRALRGAPRPEPMYRTMLRGLHELQQDRGSDRSAPGLLGFSMGGHWALWLAQRTDVEAAAVVVYYAARTVRAGAPVPVLCHLADHDPYVSSTGRRAMEASFARLGWPVRTHEYPGTGHWFAEPGGVTYDQVAAAQAFERTASFLGDPSR